MKKYIRTKSKLGTTHSVRSKSRHKPSTSSTTTTTMFNKYQPDLITYLKDLFNFFSRHKFRPSVWKYYPRRGQYR